MNETELRRFIGKRAKQRRKELKLSQQYVADKLGVNKSTIQRYENGSIDNTKKLVLESLADALHVSPEWLRGDSDTYETEVTDSKELVIRDLMKQILERFPLDMGQTESDFSKDVLILLLREYVAFTESFSVACDKYTKENTGLAHTVGFESGDEFNEIMFLREITHTVNTFSETSDILRLYSKKPEQAVNRIQNLIRETPE